MCETIKIQCPFCSALLSVKKVDGIQTKHVTCPVCKHKCLFTEFKRVKSNDDPQTDYPDDGDRTKIYTDGENTVISKESLPIGCLHVLGTNKTFQLKKGINIVGRLAKTPQADILIDTGSRRLMSRQHLKIEVVLDKSGSVSHRLSLFKPNVNKTFINNRNIAYGDCLLLSNGDVLNLPDATLKFEIQDTESTII